MARARLIPTMAFAAALGGCAAGTLQLPGVTDQQVRAAQDEIRASAPAQPDATLTDAAARARLAAVTQRLEPQARTLCASLRLGACQWRVAFIPDGAVAAFAQINGDIEVHRGITALAGSEEELAFVVAHEMGHQIANHVRAKQQARTVGANAGRVLLTALAATTVLYGGAANTPEGQRAVTEAGNAGFAAGAAIGEVAYSKQQEREADYIAAWLLYHSGYDLVTARRFVVTLGQVVPGSRAGMFDTHPAGPERLAAYDFAMRQLVAEKGQLLRPRR